MDKKYDITALGELLIDFTPSGHADTGSALFACNPGGAPGNMLTAVSRQGGKAAFIGKVGHDSFGYLLKDTIAKESIDTSGLVFDDECRTTLAFVTLDDTGNRSFAFFRNPGADIMLQADEVDENLIRDSRIFHFGSLSCTHEPARSATRFALEKAKEFGVTISYDPNLRLPLWKDAETARETILEFMPYADIVKISEEEFEFLTGEKDYEKHSKAFAEQYGISLLLVTLGPAGAYYYSADKANHLFTYDAQVVDTTGSGDAFMGAVLGQICQLDTDIADLSALQLDAIVDFGNASGSLASTVKGGIPSIPTTAQIRDCQKNIPLLEM
ncbi:PfkB family carbohydrate kinase [Scatolibacter rhodanostii]|uniref:PfkB family carbohydrate kinase n=1 Tax=Scatolibacter rhodanostii TaxID=2014781 RepID=UPI000C082C91|nr:PfkB family carbohydrate kinase [Scatolibacter rhodanostii]